MRTFQMIAMGWLTVAAVTLIATTAPARLWLDIPIAVVFVWSLWKHKGFARYHWDKE